MSVSSDGTSPSSYSGSRGPSSNTYWIAKRNVLPWEHPKETLKFRWTFKGNLSGLQLFCWIKLQNVSYQTCSVSLLVFITWKWWGRDLSTSWNTNRNQEEKQTSNQTAASTSNLHWWGNNQRSVHPRIRGWNKQADQRLPAGTLSTFPFWNNSHCYFLYWTEWPWRQQTAGPWCRHAAARWSTVGRVDSLKDVECSHTPVRRCLSLLFWFPMMHLISRLIEKRSDRRIGMGPSPMLSPD